VVGIALPRRISPAARARRSLLVDVAAAIVLAAISLSVAAGLGVIGFFGLPLLVGGLLWIAIERLHGGGRRRRSARHRDR
jgi:uncharacterized membrane protein